MFKLNEVTTTSINTVEPLDLIPYHLTGKRVLHAQGYVGKGVKVAVIDTGCDYNHDAIKDNIKIKDLQTVGYQKTSMDDHGHGTHVASTVVEIAPECEIVPVKVLSPMYGDDDAVVAGVRLAIDNDVDVINMSLSGTFRNQVYFEEFHDLVKEAVSKNIFVVVASGNTGKESTRYPACFEEVTTVGAVDINRHEAMFSTLSNQVDLCQVGVDVVGAKMGGGYVKMSGTSMATPMVAGMASLLIGKYKEQHGGKRPDGRLIHHMLKLSAIDINIKGIDTKTGAGFISLDPTASVMEMFVGNKEYKINGEILKMDIAPYVKTPENRTVTPVRYVSNGKFVGWDKASQKITIV